MFPACLHKYTFLALFLICGCVAADVHSENQTSKDQAPYVSRLNEPQSSAYQAATFQDEGIEKGVRRGIMRAPVGSPDR